MKIAIYPGSFDPIHDGHINIITKAAQLFDKLYVVISLNITKINQTDFSQRMQIVQAKLLHLPNVEIMINTHQLTSQFAKQLHATYLVRGLRSTTDFVHELEYYDGIKSLDNSLEIVYFISDLEKRVLSSSVVKEIEYFQKRKG